MKRFIEIFILALFVIYFVGDVFYSRVIERNWKIKQGEYPEKAEINFRGSFSELSEFMPGKSNELLRNAYSLMGITGLSEYNKIIVRDWDKAFFFSSLAADTGSGEAMVLLGILYAMETEHQDFGKSLSFFRKGAEYNNAIGKLVLNNIETYKIWPSAQYQDINIIKKIEEEKRPKSF